ncbi:aromatic-amino-acid transaminase [Moraxella cuniculi DSM 21768]|uniref:Aminotransferase n=1 Tax=Moraxella cuniculi DSM 21768 TaxID=1122245 RepID=A0A1N7FAF9_9GAMM|nr:amino acid aminotransferase [Moraxella cuniculi]OOS03564.1 aromatic amino acid aminotransferase [Moraxella cuniculi]SIR97256.1 aromatic-amino-acid transaminase [Moraxella cuniculi DSM 21768]
MFTHVTPYAGDPILGLMDKFANDDRTDIKVNLGVGVYYTEDGKLPVLECVKTAEAKIANPPRPRGYLPMDGLAGYKKACQELLFGKDTAVIKEGRVATIATLGGSGALKVGADFIHEWFPTAKCYVSDPTWGNHISIFEGAGLQVGKYPYYDPATIGVKFDEMCAFFETLNENDVVLLHPCCHNPTGVDLSREQWEVVLDIVKRKKLIPFMDIAYQGFGDDMDADAFAIRLAVEKGLTVFVSNSFSKNLSLYGERVGGLSVVAPTKAEADTVLGQLKFTVRRIYSSPPSHGNAVVDIVMNDEALFEQWVDEVYQMRDRIRDMRAKLQAALQQRLPERDFGYFTKQRGMFSFTGLTAAQVARLREEFAVYMVDNGRMCVAGLNNANVEYVANAIAEVLK